MLHQGSRPLMLLCQPIQRVQAAATSPHLGFAKMLGSRALQTGPTGGASKVAQHPRRNSLGDCTTTEQDAQRCTELQYICRERGGCTAKPNPSRYTRHRLGTMRDGPKLEFGHETSQKNASKISINTPATNAGNIRNSKTYCRTQNKRKQSEQAAKKGVGVEARQTKNTHFKMCITASLQVAS